MLFLLPGQAKGLFTVCHEYGELSIKARQGCKRNEQSTSYPLTIYTTPTNGHFVMPTLIVAAMKIKRALQW
jgi:hypothetical protein